MNAKLMNVVKKLHRDENGITALETAIILIAFIVVASVFAFSILSAGTYSTERGKEAVFAGLEEVQASIEVKGAIIATSATTGTGGTVEQLIFTVGNVVGGEPIDLNDANRVMIISYRDQTQQINALDWTMDWVVRNDSDDLLDSGELAEITVPLAALTNDLGINTEFTLEMKPPMGSTITLQRTTPAYFDEVIDLQ